MKRMAAFTFALLILAGVEITLDRSGADERGPAPKSNQDAWQELLNRIPYPYTTAIPADHPTAVDGLYVKFEAKQTPPIPCRRCPDYKPEGGWWKMSLRRGVFRIFHPVSGWKSLGTYSVAGERFVLNNDPVCPVLSGVYRWELNQENITLTPVEDKCSAGLRATNLSHLPWQSCDLPSNDAAVGDRRPKPAGCGPP